METDTYVAFTDPAKAEAFERHLNPAQVMRLRVSGCGNHITFRTFAARALAP
jgi:hypothetical protein